MRIYEIDTDLHPGEKRDIETQQEEKYIELIQTNCSEALAVMQKSGFLYRGVTDAPAKAFKGRSREDRNSLSSMDQMQAIFDEAMKLYGFSALRSNSIFCSGSSVQAGCYGETYIIFPINGFNMLWSNKFKDMIGDAYHIQSTLARAMNSTDKMGAIQWFVRSYQFSDTNFGEAIKSGKEIMINGSYYAFDALHYRYLFSTVLNIPETI
jgi:hypothetical protein